MSTLSATHATSDDTSSLPGRGIKPLDSLLNHTRLAIATFVALVLLGLPLAITKGTPTYQVSATVQVAPRYMKTLKDDNELDFQSNSQYRQFVEQQTKTINRYDILQAALQSLSAPDGSNPWSKPAESERRAIERLQRSLRILPVPDTYLIQVSLDSSHKDGLELVVNAVIHTYLANAKTEQVYGAGERVEQLKTREAELTQALGGLTLQRSDLARQLGVTAFTPADGNPFDKLVQKLREDIAHARTLRIDAQAKLAAFTQSGETDLVTRSVLESVLIDPGLNSLKSSLNKRRADLVTLLSGLSPAHPGYVAAQAELKEIDTEIRQHTEQLTTQVRSGLKKRFETAVEQTLRVERELQSSLQATTADSEAYAARFNQAVTLTADMEQLRKELETVRERLNFFAIESTSLGFVRPVTWALPADMPQGVGKKKLLLLLLVAATGMALLAPIAADLLDPRVRTVNDAHRALGFAPLGWLVEASEPRSAQYAQDQLRRIASALIRDQDRHGTQTVAFMGIKPGAGTTRTVRELARTLNQLGAATLAVDANAFSAHANTNTGTLYGQGAGLQALLQGASTADIQCVDSIPSLPLGKLDNSRQVAGLDGLGAVLQQLAGKYRFVLVDAPPLLSASDSELIARAAGAVVAVVEADGITKGELARAAQLLQKLDPPSLGAVVNRIQPFEGGGYIHSLITEHHSGRKHPPQALSHSLRTVARALLWDATALSLRAATLTLRPLHTLRRKTPRPGRTPPAPTTPTTP